MKVFTVVTALLLIGAVCAGPIKEYRVKGKNPLLQKEENDVIDIDETKGTETIKTQGQNSLKDFYTGYGAIKVSDKQECFVFELDDAKEQRHIRVLEKDLNVIQKSGKTAVAREMSVKYLRGETKLTDEQRAEIGQNILDFCESLQIILGRTGLADGEEEEQEEGPSENHVLNRRKRQTFGQNCSYQLYYVPYCVRYFTYYCYYTVQYIYICGQTAAG